VTDYLLDSNILIWHLRGRKDVVEVLTGLASEGSLACSAVSVLEVQAGVKRGEQERTDAFLDGLDVRNVDRQIASQAGHYIRKHREKGITLDFADAIIASTAVIGDLMLVTENAAHFPMPEVRLLTPRNGSWANPKP